jgi:predicted transcriptional regulator
VTTLDRARADVVAGDTQRWGGNAEELARTWACSTSTARRIARQLLAEGQIVEVYRTQSGPDGGPAVYGKPDVVAMTREIERLRSRFAELLTVVAEGIELALTEDDV